MATNQILIRRVRSEHSPSKDEFNPDQCDSRLDSLAVTGHVHLQVIRVVQHLGSKQIVLQVTPQFSKLQQFSLIKYGPAGKQQATVEVKELNTS